MQEPEIVIKTQERNSSEFPVPAVTICLDVFARENKADLYRISRIYLENGIANLTQDECFTMYANFHWCDIQVGRKIIKKFCENYDFNDVDVVEAMFKTALTVKHLIE